MWIICILIGLFQLIILLMLSGILFSVAAISRLMEITIILVYPTAIFLLRQAANLIIILTILMVRLTFSAFHKLCILVKCDQQLQMTLQQRSVAQLQLDIETPFVPYKSSILEEIPQDLRSLKLNMETPFVPYKNSILEEIPQDLRSLKDEFFAILSADNLIIEPAQNQVSAILSADNLIIEPAQNQVSAILSADNLIIEPAQNQASAILSADNLIIEPAQNQDNRKEEE